MKTPSPKVRDTHAPTLVVFSDGLGFDLSLFYPFSSTLFLFLFAWGFDMGFNVREIRFIGLGDQGFRTHLDLINHHDNKGLIKSDWA